MAAPPTKPGGYTLYADLLEPKNSSTISGAPVKYDIQRQGSSGDEEAQQKKKDASLKFQPIKRPFVQKKAKSKPSSSSSSIHRPSSSTVTAASASSPDRPQAQIPSSTPLLSQSSAQRSNFQDWVGDEEDEFYYQDSRARGGKKRKRKGNNIQQSTWEWGDVYEPMRPNEYADYKGSEEQHQEKLDWKARLHYHEFRQASREARNGNVDSDSEDAERRPRTTNMMFAPPSGMSFAPPSFEDNQAAIRAQQDDDDDYFPQSSDSRPPSRSYEAPSSFAPAPLADDADGESAYLRRMQMTGMAPTTSISPPVVPLASSTPPAVAPLTASELETKRAEAQARITAIRAEIEKQKQMRKPDTPPAVPPPPPSESAPTGPVQSFTSTSITPPAPPPGQASGATISRAPVRYEQPAPPTTLNEHGDHDSPIADTDRPAPEPEDHLRSNRPGKKGFAARLLKKMGWEEGQGLGATGDGITTAIIAKADKRKRKPDAQGGGWAAPPNMGKIVGGKKRKIDADPNSTEDATTNDPRFGKMSEVIKLESMLDGLDVKHEIEDNNLMQEIGDEMGREYGNVERVFIWREEKGGANEVFVKFTSQLGALRAVNGMSGVEFAGNEVKAKFWDAEAFENEEYA